MRITARTVVTLAAAGLAVLLGAQWREISTGREMIETLRAQAAAREAALRMQSDPPREEAGELDRLRAEVAQLSGQVLQLRNALAAGEPKTSSARPRTPEISPSPPANPGRELGLAIARGETAAVDRLSALSKAEHQEFRTNSAGLDAGAKGDAAFQTFAPIRAAFDALTEQALQGNQNALEAISRALAMPELKGLAAQATGVLAANGDASALNILTHPEDYSMLLSTAVGALKPAADNGKPDAIAMLASVATNQGAQALWHMTADGLGQAAASGNSAAIDALISLLQSSGNNPSVRSAAMQGLMQAASNQNQKASEALAQARAL